MRILFIISLLLSQIYSFDNRPLHVLLAGGLIDYDYDDMFHWQSDSNSQNVIYLHFETSGMQDSTFMFHEFIEVAEDYWPFNVNVTTDSNIYQQTPLSNKVRLRYNEQAPINTSGQSCGECEFGTELAQNEVWSKFANNTGTGSHEIGHTFNLRHDWSYESPGYERGSRQHRPIMGSSSEALGSGSDMKYRTFWNLSPYAFGGVEDDFAVIESFLGKRPDVEDESFATAQSIQLKGDSILAINNFGFITYDRWEHPDFGNEIDSVYTDTDFWKIQIPEGTLDLDITPTKISNNLHLVTTLYDSELNMIQIGEPLDNNHYTPQASKHLIELSAGTYYLQVDPSGSPSINGEKGYPVYGSVGYYQFEGTIRTANSTSLWSSEMVNANESVIHQYQILNLSGQVISILNSKKVDLNRNFEALNLKPGIYFLKSNQSIIKKNIY